MKLFRIWYKYKIHSVPFGYFDRYALAFIEVDFLSFDAAKNYGEYQFEKNFERVDLAN